METRLKELDYLKCVFIVLMVIFHLVYIGDKYPSIKLIVYTFHMPAFLIISGYLVNIRKESKPFFRGMVWMFIPFAVMEIGYVVMSAVLPVREQVADVNAWLLLRKVFFAPMGPYWYLHTLIVCTVTYYLVYKLGRQLNGVSRFIALGFCYFLISWGLGILSFVNAVYFMAGIAIYQSRQSFLSLFQPSFLAILPFVFLCWFPENWDRSTLGGVAITYLAINLSLWVYRYLPEKAKRVSHFIGRNTFVILLFSPIFTILSKVFIPVFSFDSSGICFMLVSVLFVIAGCMAVAWGIDRMHLSRFCFGKKHVLQ